MIEHSSGEAASLIKLGARGVGYPWGVAEEASHVSHWLAQRQLPCLDVFSVLFAWVDKREFSELILQFNDDSWHCEREELCPLLCGSAILDSIDSLVTMDRLTLKNVVCPILLLPFISEASVFLQRSLRLTWTEGEIIINGKSIESVRNGSSLLVVPNSLASLNIGFVRESLEHGSALGNSDVDNPDALYDDIWPVTALSRVSINTNTLAMLKDIAHRTYAPATEASRMSGAGAGTSDND